MTAPERIIASRPYAEVEGDDSVPEWHEDTGRRFAYLPADYKVKPTSYVRADLYDAAVAERDEARRKAEVLEASVAFERCTIAEVKLEAHHLRVRRYEQEETIKQLVSERDAARAEVERLRPVVNAAVALIATREAYLDAEDAQASAELNVKAWDETEVLVSAVAAYLAAKEGKP